MESLEKGFHASNSVEVDPEGSLVLQALELGSFSCLAFAWESELENFDLGTLALALYFNSVLFNANAARRPLSSFESSCRTMTGPPHVNLSVPPLQNTQS